MLRGPACFQFLATSLLIASRVIAADMPRGADRWEAKRRCTFAVPLRDGRVLQSESEPLSAFGKWVVRVDGRALSIEGRTVDIESARKAWGDCACWKALDATPLVGRRFPSAAATTDGSAYTFVEVFAPYCGACYWAIRESDRSTTAGGAPLRKLTISGGDDDDRKRWESGLRSTGVRDSQRWRHVFLPATEFETLVRQLALNGDAGRSFVLAPDGTIVHACIAPQILPELLGGLPPVPRP